MEERFMQQSPFPKQSPEPHHHRDTTALIFGNEYFNVFIAKIDAENGKD